jgi:hypothetical protein
MPFRLKAFGLHLLASAGALTLVVGGLYFGWYGWPGWYLSGVLHVVGIVVLVDLVVGPTLTLIVSNPAKPRRELARDIAIIVTVQLAALVYGTATLWSGRPLYYTFSVNCLELVQASDIDNAERALALRQNPALAPRWHSRPRWVWAPLPDDASEAMRIMTGATLGSGRDIIDMPRYFKPWEQGLPKLRDQLRRLEDMKYLSKPQQQTLRARLAERSLPVNERNMMVMWGGSQRLLVVFDPATLHILAILRA